MMDITIVHLNKRYFNHWVYTMHWKIWWRLNLVMRDKIAKLITPPIFPVTYMVYCKGWELKFGHRKFTVDIATVPFGFV